MQVWIRANVLPQEGGPSGTDYELLLSDEDLDNLRRGVVLERRTVLAGEPTAWRVLRESQTIARRKPKGKTR